LDSTDGPWLKKGGSDLSRVPKAMMGAQALATVQQTRATAAKFLKKLIPS
jgi:hypothetical protein